MNIQLLDIETSNRIAAGEVVDRPASVIKELCENALDAGSTAITVEIENGGLGYMRVVDNGAGMTHEELPMAFLRHATSKIKSGDSLMGIESMGFRGEALAAIAAVSQIQATTRQRDAQTGSRIELNGGALAAHLAYGCPEGTAVTVRNLFFNTPARLKFTKSPAAETAQISDALLRLMLSNPKISFRYLNAGKTVMQTPGTGLYDALLAIYGEEACAQCIAVDIDDEVRLVGYIGRPELSRATRTAQTLVVNGRYIRNNAIANAVSQGYGERLMTGRFPFFVLHLTLPFAAVDVNVHPQKLEVRFTDEQALSMRVTRAIQSAWQSYRLRANEGVGQEATEQAMKLHRDTQEVLPTTQANDHYITGTQPAQRDNFDEDEDMTLAQRLLQWQLPLTPTSSGLGQLRESAGIQMAIPVNDREEQHEQPRFEAEYAGLGLGLRVIGQLFGTYVLAEGEESLLVIDQHAAHERLTYDRLLDQVNREQVQSQLLLRPLYIELTLSDMQAFETMQPSLARLGFEIEPFGETGLAVRALPAAIKDVPVRALLMDVLNLARAVPMGELPQLHERIVRAACRHSIKAGDMLEKDELDALLARLRENEKLTCPHGRPIAMRIPKRELEKGFKRIV